MNEPTYKPVTVVGTALYGNKEFTIIGENTIPLRPIQLCDEWGFPIDLEDNPWRTYHTFLFTEITEHYIKRPADGINVFLYSEPALIHLPIGNYAFIHEEPHTIYVIDSSKEEPSEEPRDIFDTEEDNSVDTGATHI